MKSLRSAIEAGELDQFVDGFYKEQGKKVPTMR
jgi:queuine/archaeosine tRNA-ribosyltransferase